MERPGTDTWAGQQFGGVEVGDERRTRRLVTLAAAVMAAPGGSLPEQTGSWAACKAAYRLLANPAVTPEAVTEPHRRWARAAAEAAPVTLLVQDTTIVDQSSHRATVGLGPVGNGWGQGFHLHSVLAVAPESGDVRGVVHHEMFRRIARGQTTGETRTQRAGRDRESDVWIRAVRAVGAPATGARWVHVGDRGADLFALMAACRAVGVDFLVRACQDRSVETEAGAGYLLTAVAACAPIARVSVEVPQKGGRPARTASCAVTICPAAVRGSSSRAARRQTLPVWVVRVWEDVGPDGIEPLDWTLTTSVPTTTPDEALERVRWYMRRWRIEEYHKCLKTGCRIEERRLADGDRLMRLTALLIPVAVALLSLRDASRTNPNALATTAVPADVVVVVAASTGTDPATLTTAQFWRAVARRGGFLGRRGDGDPGWQVLWRGWNAVMLLCEGAALAARLPTICG